MREAMLGGRSSPRSERAPSKDGGILALGGRAATPEQPSERHSGPRVPAQQVRVKLRVAAPGRSRQRWMDHNGRHCARGLWCHFVGARCVGILAGSHSGTRTVPVAARPELGLGHGDPCVGGLRLPPVRSPVGGGMPACRAHRGRGESIGPHGRSPQPELFQGGRPPCPEVATMPEVSLPEPFGIQFEDGIGSGARRGIRRSAPTMRVPGHDTR